MLTHLQELRDKGGLDETRRKNLDDGIGAAKSILARANEAIHKEQRLNAVNDLQQRVEDWKGHKLDHFGELLLHGNYTVLKGEGAKEVEREVSTVFGSLVATSRNHLRCMLGASQRPCPLALSAATAKCHSSPPSPTARYNQSRSRTPFAASMELPPMSMRLSSQKQGIKLSLSGSEPHFQGPGAPSDLKSHLLRRSQTCRQLPYSEPVSPAPHRSLTRSQSRSQLSLRVTNLFIPRSPKATPNPTFPQVPHAAPMPHDAENNIVAQQADPSIKLNAIAESNVLLPHASTHLPARYANVSPSDMCPMNLDACKKSTFEDQIANGSAFTSPQREQYKVYLFESILLCCKEINLNKPKNKMLGTNKPLVDKKGQPKLQLKGRIFMQNVTDVLTFSRIGKQRVDGYFSQH